MLRNLMLGILCFAATSSSVLRADIVTDWNATLNEASKLTQSKHNPGIPTRAMAMMNATIYDVFQAIDRTHAPFKINTFAPGASLDAAVAQAAFRVISDNYGEQQAMLDSVLASRLGAVPDGPAKTAGITLGNLVAQQYIDAHANDGHSLPDQYTPTDAPGHWSSDPLHPGQKGWGADWGFVTPWAMPGPEHFNAMINPPDMQSQRYVDAFNQVKDYGALNSSVRTPDQTAMGLFWAYDRPGTGAPPVLFVENLIDIANQIGNSPAENARMFAMATVAQADACIAAWHVKYDVDFWRPITAIRADADHDDDNPNTIEDPTWLYLGAPGDDPNSSSDDFTPPFPAYTSGHATMGGAIFKSVELFYGTNDFATADAMVGVDPVTGQYTLYSSEPGSGGSRDFVRFTQVGPLAPGLEDSPEGENGMSRIYLGIHWIFDQEDGITLGNAVAEYVAGHYFQAVPEPGTVVLILLGAITIASLRHRGRAA